MKTDTQMTIEQYEAMIDNDYAELQAKRAKAIEEAEQLIDNDYAELIAKRAKAKISANEPVKYKIDVMSHSKIDDSNLVYENASDSVIDAKIEEAKAFAQSAKDYKAFQAWDKNNKANSKPVDISVQPVKSNVNKSSDEMLNDFNTFNYKKYTKQKWPISY